MRLAKTRSALANSRPKTTSSPTVMPTLRSATSSCPRRDPARVSRPLATHGIARTVPAAQVSGASTAAGADRDEVTATTPAQAAASAQSATTQPASRTATTATSTTDSTAVSRSFTFRRRISAGAAAAHTTRPTSAAPSPGWWPTSSAPPSTPTTPARTIVRVSIGRRRSAQNGASVCASRPGSRSVRTARPATQEGGGPGSAGRWRGRRCSGVGHGRHARHRCPCTSETWAGVRCTLCGVRCGASTTDA